MPFFDHGCEPVLCAAVRLGCSAEIVRMLITAGAAINSSDSMGRSPIQILTARPCLPQAIKAPFPGTELWDDSFGPKMWQGVSCIDTPELKSWRHAESLACDESKKNSATIADLLLKAGATVELNDCDGDRSPFELARVTGNEHLISLFFDHAGVRHDAAMRAE